MNIHDYHTIGGKNVIKDYLKHLPNESRMEGYRIRFNINRYGLEAFPLLDTRQLQGKLWEIRFSNERIVYVIADKDNIYFLHVCKKQKDKTETFELNKAIKRAKELGLL